jgi:hypothetical protein
LCRRGIRIALMLFRYKQPRRRDPLAWARYHQCIAEGVVAKIMTSNWALMPRLQETGRPGIGVARIGLHAR